MADLKVNEDKELVGSLLDELFDNINKLPTASTLQSMKEFHLKSIKIIDKLEIIENKYKGDDNGKD